jgi:hypothetical protein
MIRLLYDLIAVTVALLILSIAVPADVVRRVYVAAETEFDRWGGWARVWEGAAWAGALLLCLLAETADQDDEVLPWE